MHLFLAPSAAPASVGVTSTSFFSIALHWEPVPCMYQNGGITGYTVKYWIRGNEDSYITSTVAERTGVTISNLVPSTSYYFQLAAINSGGTGIFSDTVSAETSTYTNFCTTESFNLFFSTENLVSVFLESSSSISLSIRWLLAENLTATSYSITYTYTNSNCFTTLYDSIVTIETNAFLSGLEEGTQYSITITTALSSGETGKDGLMATTMPIGLC